MYCVKMIIVLDFYTYQDYCGNTYNIIKSSINRLK